MLRRTELVKKRCGVLGKPKSLDNLARNELPPRPLISDRYKVFACKAAKVASTNLQRIFYILNRLTNETDPGKVGRGAARKHTNEFFGQKRNKTIINPLLDRLKTYTRFFFIRHPLERFVSAYRDQKPNGFFRPLRKEGKEQNFLEYIDYCLSRANYSRPIMPMYMLCKPCDIQYDFIGSLDDFDDDITTILKAIGADKAVNIPQRNNTGYKQKKSSTVVREFFKDVPQDKIEKLEKLYEIDYFLFGFERFSDMK